MVSVKSASRYVTSASRYQSRSSMYISSLIPQNSTEWTEAVLIGLEVAMYVSMLAGHGPDTNPFAYKHSLCH